MNLIEERLEAVKQRLALAEANANRAAGSVKLLAVSKTQPAEVLLKAYQLGLRDFGENYLQEALAKQAELNLPDIVWHFIGPIQSNKTRPLAEHFDWVHSVDRLKIAERLSEQRPSELPDLNICIQVNISDEASKSGVSLDELSDLVQAVKTLPRLKLRGLMAIPAPTHDFSEQRLAFRKLSEAMNTFEGLDTLSMGMSDDLEAAVLEGSTLVRIGSAIFGARKQLG